MSRAQFLTKAFAGMLSFSCFAWGSVYDWSTALLILGLVAISIMFKKTDAEVNQKARFIIISIFLIVGAVVLLQFTFPPNSNALSIWESTNSALKLERHLWHSDSVLDKNAFVSNSSFFFIVLLCLLISGHICSSNTLMRTFFSSLLISAVILTSISLFVFALNRGQSNFETYSHGFVNANNAASYLGSMLLLAVAHCYLHLRSIFQPMSLGRVLHRLSSLTAFSSLLLSCHFFAVVLFTAGLFLTASRAGIGLSLLALFFFTIIIIIKAGRVRETLRLYLLSIIIGCTVVFWVFSNTGGKFEAEILNSDLELGVRKDVAEASIKIITDFPFLGVGLGAYDSMFQSYRPSSISPEGLWDKAHNTYLDFAIEFGIIAAALVVMLIVYVFISHIKGIIKSRGDHIYPSLGLSIGLLIAFHSLVDFPTQIPGFAAMISSILLISAYAPKRRRRKRLHHESVFNEHSLH